MTGAGTRSARLLRVGAGAAIVGGLVTIAGFALDPARALFAWLVAYTWALGIVLGALVFLLAAHAMKATWPVVLRRTAETVVSTLPLFVVLFVPLAVGAPKLYAWAAGEAHGHAGHAGWQDWLRNPWFTVRSAVYLAAWIVPAELLRRWSLRQDADGDALWTLKARRLSAGALVAVAFALTFASFDWLMSLVPEWFSSVFGVYWFAGGFLGAFALLVVLAHAGRVAGPLALVTPEHFSALGRMLFAFVVFWAYIAYSQYFVYWIADVPEEIVWWVPRLNGAWAFVTYGLWIGQFGIPFFLLLPRAVKKRPRPMVAVSLWCLAFHYLDTWWLALPSFDAAVPRPHWADLGAVLLVGGAAVAFGAWRAAGHAPVALRDPFLAPSREYRAA